jgi:hypothetical protein
MLIPKGVVTISKGVGTQILAISEVICYVLQPSLPAQNADKHCKNNVFTRFYESFHKSWVVGSSPIIATEGLSSEMQGFCFFAR